MRAALRRTIAASAVCAAVTAPGGCGRSAAPGRAATRPADAARAARPPCPTARRDPAAPGPYLVGRASVALRRDSAVEPRSRPIDPDAWFPTATRRGTALGCRAPVILWSHGLTGNPFEAQRLLAHLASEGYVVLAPHHPDRRTPRGEGNERQGDVRYLLDHLASTLERLHRGLASRVDPTRIGVAGHSLGASTAAQLGAADGRLRTVLLIAGGNAAAAPRLHLPTFVVAGGRDTIVPIAEERRFVAGLPRSTPHRLLVLPRGDHWAGIDRCAHEATCAVVAAYATRFELAYLAPAG
jgi:predicted dienelactone hydrolase